MIVTTELELTNRRKDLKVMVTSPSFFLGGGAVSQWLKYCATNRKVAGSRWCHWNFSLT